MNLRDIARLCAASHLLDEARARLEPTAIVIDSRAVVPGGLFVALPGERVDGHNFVREVFDKGAAAALVVHHRLPFATELGELADRLLFVENTLCAFQQLAARVLAKWHRPIVGITGSAGKTTMKDLTAHLLGATGSVLKSLGNLNTGFGLPLTVGRMISGGASPGEFDLAVLEMGMSSFGEIARLTDLAPPDVGVVGNVGLAHLEFFGTQDRIARAKAEMVEGIKPGGTAVLNADDPRVIRMRELRGDVAIVSFGIDEPADVSAHGIAVAPDLSATRFELRTPAGRAEARLPMLGRHNVYNALAAAAAATSFGLSAERIAERLAEAAPSAMRGELIRFPNGVMMIDDSYNSNPRALIESVRAMFGAGPGGGISRRIVVAGEMLELGAAGADMHREAGREIAALGVDRLIGVRGLAREMASAAGESMDAAFCETPEDAATLLLGDLRPGDLILVKGSRGVRTERVVERIRAALTPERPA